MWLTKLSSRAPSWLEFGVRRFCGVRPGYGFRVAGWLARFDGGAVLPGKLAGRLPRSLPGKLPGKKRPTMAAMGPPARHRRVDDDVEDPATGRAEAAALADGVTDRGTGSAVPRFFLIYLLIAVLVTVCLATLLLGTFGVDWPSSLRLGLTLPGMVALIGMFYGYRKVLPLVPARRTSVLRLLDRAEQKRVRRQIHGRSALS